MKQELEQVLSKVQKPARYIGGEMGCVYKEKADVWVRFAFAFPDTYEIGMSHLGMKILYHLLNALPNCWCERVFAPWVDMEEELIKNKLALFALESYDSLDQFDIIGFSLQYELSYTNMLQMLSLGRVPLYAKERKGLQQLVIAGGPCTCNPEPLCDFVDAFFLGEAEESLPAFVQLYDEAKQQGWSKEAFLKKATEIPGIYVPSLYCVTYQEDGTVAQIEPLLGAPQRVKKAIVKEMDQAVYPSQFIVPYLQVVHDRAMVELMRGCIRGCRFCQAGFIYRPLREKSPELLYTQAKLLCENSGYEEISLSSLSTSDYSGLSSLLDGCLTYTEKNHVNMSLPSLRVDNFSKELLEKVAKVRKSGLTFAPEAGTQRLRNAINKNVTEQEIMQTCEIAFAGGYHVVKLYFMLGLPTETMEDIAGISALAQQVVDLYYSLDKEKRKGGRPEVTVSVATFVPKPFTPFQWEPQITREEMKEKQKHLLRSTTSRRVRLSWSDSNTSILEGVLARGDRRLGRVIYRAWEQGCHLDSWDEQFDFSKWEKAFVASGLTMEFYASRRRDAQEVFPWSHLDFGVSQSYLLKENQKAKEGETTPNCRIACGGCGANQLAPCKPKKHPPFFLPSQEKPMAAEPKLELESQDYQTLRVFYQKTGSIRWISHLDMLRCMQRALKRAGLPIWYSKGFHPHPYLTFALPLSLGYQSRYECMDFRLLGNMPCEEVAKKLKMALPHGITLLGVDVPKMKGEQITSADYQICFYGSDVPAIYRSIQTLLQSQEIIVSKKSKKGMRSIDLKPDIQHPVLSCQKDHRIELMLNLPAGSYMRNPQLLLQAFDAQFPDVTYHVEITRMMLYGGDKNFV